MKSSWLILAGVISLFLQVPHSIQTPFLFQKGQKFEKVTLNIIINGKGAVWVDDIVLTKEPLN